MITVGLYKSNTVVSKLIRWQTRGTYSHAALHLGDGSAVEAWHKGGVQHGPIGHLHDKGTEIDCFSIEAFVFEDLVKAYALEQVGKKYDFRMVARFVSRLGETSGSKQKLFCSELVFDALVYGGLPLFERTKGWEVSPDLLKRSPYLKYSNTIRVGE